MWIFLGWFASYSCYFLRCKCDDCFPPSRSFLFLVLFCFITREKRKHTSTIWFHIFFSSFHMIFFYICVHTLFPLVFLLLFVFVVLIMMIALDLSISMFICCSLSVLVWLILNLVIKIITGQEDQFRISLTRTIVRYCL